MRATDRQAVRLACLLDGSRMSREVHVRFCERPKVKFLRPTHPQIITVQDGKVWLFGVIEHWNAETLGWQGHEPQLRVR